MKSDNIFDKLKLLKNEQPLVDRQELRSMLGNDKSGTKSKYNINKGVIMTLAFLSLFTAALFLFVGGNENVETKSIAPETSGTVFTETKENTNTVVQTEDVKTITNDKIVPNTAENKEGSSVNQKSGNSIQIVADEMNKSDDNKNRATITIGSGSASGSSKTDDFFKEAQKIETVPFEKIPYIELSIAQAEKIGIKIDDKCRFTIEEIDRIYPISLKRNYYYKSQPEIKELVEKNYDLTGKKFLVKKDFALELSDKEVFEHYEKMKANLYHLKKIYKDDTPGLNTTDSADVDRFFKTYNEQVKLDRIKSNETVRQYDGAPIKSFNRIAPIRYQCYYKDGSKIDDFCFNAAIAVEHEKAHGLPALDEIVPIRITLPESDPDGREYFATHIEFWFLPTKEFLEALPEDIAKRLENEIEILDLLNIGMPASEACKGIEANTSFFQICGLHSGAVSIIKAYPNPVESVGMIRFKLEEKRRISIALYDEKGNKKADVVKNTEYPAGGYESMLNMSSYPAGMYIISITSSHDENCSIRLIKN